MSVKTPTKSRIKSGVPNGVRVGQTAKHKELSHSQSENSVNSDNGDTTLVRTGTWPADRLGATLDPADLVDRFHQKTPIYDRWRDAERVVRWVQQLHLAYSEFEIPLVPCNYERLPLHGSESKFHCHAKVSVGEWLGNQLNAEVHYERDGFDVFCSGVVAEIGNTSFNRFVWLLGGQYSRLLLVEKPGWRDAAVSVMSFTPTATGLISRGIDEMGEFEERRRMMEAASRIVAPFLAAELRMPTPNASWGCA